MINQTTNVLSVVTYGSASEPVAFAMHRSAADEAEIIAIGVVPPQRRRGIASGLLSHMIDDLRQAGVRTVFLEVAVENQGARALYGRYDFREVGLLKGYYNENNGTALVLQSDLR